MRFFFKNCECWAKFHHSLWLDINTLRKYIYSFFFFAKKTVDIFVFLQTRESTCVTSAVTRARSPTRWRSIWLWTAASRRAPNSGPDWLRRSRKRRRRRRRRTATTTERSRRRSGSVWRRAPPIRGNRYRRPPPLSRRSALIRQNRRPAVVAVWRQFCHLRGSGGRHFHRSNRPSTGRRRRRRRRCLPVSSAATMPRRPSSTGAAPKWKPSSATSVTPNKVTCAYIAAKCTLGSTDSKFTSGTRYPRRTACLLNSIENVSCRQFVMITLLWAIVVAPCDHQFRTNLLFGFPVKSFVGYIYIRTVCFFENTKRAVWTNRNWFVWGMKNGKFSNRYLNVNMILRAVHTKKKNSLKINSRSDNRKQFFFFFSSFVELTPVSSLWNANTVTGLSAIRAI